MSSYQSPHEQQADALLICIRKLSELFWGPDLQKCSEMLTGDFWHSFRAVAAGLKCDLPGAVKRIEADLENYSDVESLFQYLETAYVRLFISHRDGIAAPLYESCYDGVESSDKASLMGKPALKMTQRFESKGLSIDPNIHEPPDHLAIELEYLYFLLSKGWEANDVKLIAEAGSFAAETMLPWVSKLQKQIAVQMPDHAYTGLISFLTAILHLIGQFDLSQNSRSI